MRLALGALFFVLSGFIVISTARAGSRLEMPAEIPPAPVTGANRTSAPAGLEGTWEGFIAETPARLTRIGVELKRAGEGLEMTIDLPGAPPGLPLSAIRADGTDLHFELQVGETLVVFDAAYEDDAIVGRVVEGDREYSFEIHKLPIYPKPANRVEAWKQDLDVVRSRFLKYDRSFTPETRAVFEQALDEIESSMGDMNDQEIVVALSEAIALSGNAHTRLYLLRNRTELRRLPVRLYWFTDGLFVIRATPAHRKTLGCRVARLAGREPRKVRERVARLFAGNESWIDYKSPYFMTSPEILYGLGLIADMESVPLRFDCRGREPFERALAPLPLQRKEKPTEAWRDLSPRWVGKRGDGNGDRGHGGDADDDRGDVIDWLSALPADQPVPLYLREPQQHYWFEHLADSKALYLQYNRSQNIPDGPSFADFAEEVETLLEQHPIDLIILDLRFNTGGNNGIAAPFMERLAALEKGKTIGRLYVITGRSTFWAGISHAAHLKQSSNAIFVGEPIGDELDTWSEGGNIVLPNSGLTVHFTNGFHSLSNVERPEFEEYRWTDLDLGDLAPDTLVRFSSDDYFSGRDPTLAAILSSDPGR